MTDYYCQINGVFPGGIGWSSGLHITSNQAEAALSTTWTNAWTSAWTDATNGLEGFYPTGTHLTGTSVATLNATMHEISKTRATMDLPGTQVADTLPYQEAVVVSWRGNSIQRHGRGRQFLPALAENQVNGDIVIPAAQASIKAAMNIVKAAIQADGSSIFVTNKKPLKDGTLPFGKVVVTTPLVSNKPARQSRRVRHVVPSYL